ncbi:unnamed protein product [Chrysoparadoxa australica]
MRFTCTVGLLGFLSPLADAFNFGPAGFPGEDRAVGQYSGSPRTCHMSTGTYSTAGFGESESNLWPANMDLFNRWAARRKEKKPEEDEETEAAPPFELSLLSAEEQAVSLQRGLLRLSEMFGWCQSQADEAAIGACKEEMVGLTSYLSDVERLRVEVATEVAYQAHMGQYRKSGDAFITHPMAVARILAGLKMDADSVVAGLLHDTVEDTRLSFEDIEQQFGHTVRRLVEGETKVSKLPERVAAFNQTVVGMSPPTAAFRKQAENLRHMLLAMSEDWRVLVIKLSDRLHNMRTIGSMAPHKQERIARETMELFVPLAHRLGLWEIKCELEDLCFALLHPVDYTYAKQLVDKFTLMTGHTPEVLEGQRQALEKTLQERFSDEVTGLTVQLKHKPLYSVWRARQRSNSTLLSLQDVVAFRVVFCEATKEGEENRRDDEFEKMQREKALCYTLLEAVHSVLPPKSPLRVKDYISIPKSNGYASLHSIVLLSGYPCEVQIRTASMDRKAEYGVAASWLQRYRSQRASCMRLPWLMEVQKEAEAVREDLGDMEYTASVRSCLEGTIGRRFVFTSQGTILDLDGNAAVRDAALELNNDKKERVVMTKVNGKLVGMNHPLQNGDVVTIMTSPYALEEPDQEEKVTEGSAAESKQLEGATSEGQAQPGFFVGKVHVQVVESGKVWPWSLVGSGEGEEYEDSWWDENMPPPWQQQQRIQVMGERSPKSLVPMRASSADSTAQMMPPEKGDMRWYREAEVKHARLAMAVLSLWAGAEVVNILGVGTGHQHSSLLERFAATSPLQAFVFIGAVGLMETAYGVWRGALSANQQSEMRSNDEINRGRAAMLLCLALSVETISTGTDSLAHMLGLF